MWSEMNKNYPATLGDVVLESHIVGMKSCKRTKKTLMYRRSFMAIFYCHV